MPTSVLTKVTVCPTLIETVVGPKVCIEPFFQIPEPGNMLMVAPPASGEAAAGPACAKSVRGSLVGALGVKLADRADAVAGGIGMAPCPPWPRWASSLIGAMF